VLRRTATPIPNATANGQGRGRIQIAEALKADVSGVASQPLSATGTGTLDGSRGGMERVVVECDGTEKVLDDETTSWCEAWNGASWRADDWTGASWRSADWTGASWRTDAWSGASWRDATFAGASWRSDTWTGASWRGASWRTDSFTGASWRDDTWTSGGYGDGESGAFLVGFWGPRPGAGVHLPGELNEADLVALCRGQRLCQQ